MTYTDKAQYIGEWKNDLKHGRGKLIYASGGGSWEGEWREGKKQGRGVHTDEKGIAKEGYWRKGMRIRWIQDNKAKSAR